MNKEFENYTPEYVEMKKNKEYFNNNQPLKGGSKKMIM